MRFGPHFAGAFLAVASTAVLAGASPESVPPRETVYDSVQLSPDGRRIGFIAGVGERGDYRALFFRDLSTGKTTAVQAYDPHLAEDDKIHRATNVLETVDFKWLTSNRVAIGLGRATEGILRWDAADCDGTRWWNLAIDVSTGSMSQVTNVLWTSGHSEEFLTLARYQKDGMINEYFVTTPLVYRVNTASQSQNNLSSSSAIWARKEYWCVASDMPGIDYWVPDREGNIRVGISLRDGGTRAIHRKNDDDAWSPLGNLGRGEYPMAIDWDGRTAYEATLGKTGTWCVARYDLLTQTKGPIIASGGDHNIVDPRDPYESREHFLFATGKRRLIGIRYQAETVRTIWLDADMARAQATFDHYFPNAANVICSWSDDCSKVVVAVWSGRRSPTYVLLDTKARKLGRLFK